MAFRIRRKKAIFSLLSMSATLLLAPLYLGSLEDRALDNYPKDSFMLDAVDVREYKARGNGFDIINTSKYYELELYSKDKKRYFFRSPHPKKLFQIKYQLREEDRVVIFHLEEIEKNGGQRIIELREGRRTLISFEQVVYEERYSFWIMRLMGLVTLIMALLIVWLPNRHEAPNESVS